MTVYPYSGRIGRAASDNRHRLNPERLGPNVLDWAKQRRVNKMVRQTTAAEERVADRLGPQWHVIEGPNVQQFAADLLDPGRNPKAPPPLSGFLAIGPGGIFNVSIAQHGRSRVLIAGDVVQIGGQRPPYIPHARRNAKRAAKTMSGVIGQEIKVFAVLAFVGSGTISVNGLPKECLITSYQELGKVLEATGTRISPVTAEKLSLVARYSWYPEESTPGDKGLTRG